jgi:ABC-type uncharacterized transport system substrate-binding protein
VRVIVVGGAVNATLAAKAATATIPIVFSMGSDPVQMGLVTNLSRPGGNVTGVTQISTELTAKRLEMLRELLPSASAIGLLVNPSNPNTQPSVSEMQALANAGGWLLHVVPASSEVELDGAIAKLVELKVDGFLSVTDALLNNIEMAALAARHRIPTIFQNREFAEAGGLMSYGANRAETQRVVADYTSRILEAPSRPNRRSAGHKGRAGHNCEPPGARSDISDRAPRARRRGHQCGSTWRNAARSSLSCGTAAAPLAARAKQQREDAAHRRSHGDGRRRR